MYPSKRQRLEFPRGAVFREYFSSPNSTTLTDTFASPVPDNLPSFCRQLSLILPTTFRQFHARMQAKCHHPAIQEHFSRYCVFVPLFFRLSSLNTSRCLLYSCEASYHPTSASQYAGILWVAFSKSGPLYQAQTSRWHGIQQPPLQDLPASSIPAMSQCWPMS